jgi:hypothetical protein
VDPVTDPLLLSKSGSYGNRTRTDGSLRPYSRISRRKPLLFLSSSFLNLCHHLKATRQLNEENSNLKDRNWEFLLFTLPAHPLRFRQQEVKIYSFHYNFPISLPDIQIFVVNKRSLKIIRTN